MPTKDVLKENRVKKQPEVREQTSILSNIEKKTLIWMALKIPRTINSDHLTLLGVVGAFVSGAGYALTGISVHFFWLASLGLIINWFGDSLDGTLARVRNAQRPLYGFFLDHNIDGMTVLFITLGVGISPLISFSVAMMVLAGYLLLSIYTYINTYLRGTLKLSYSSLGPTEFRIILILLNVFFVLTEDLPRHFLFYDNVISLYDLLTLIIAIILFIIYLAGFFKDLKEYARLDPPKQNP
jgi:archaetidylinositol phosphate synthase